MFTEFESKCKRSSDRLICKNLKIWSTNENKNCVWNLFNHLSRDGCTLERVENKNTLFEIRANRFIFSLYTGIDVVVVCLNSVFNQKMEGEGILELHPRCSLNNIQFKLETAINFENMSNIIIPDIRLDKSFTLNESMAWPDIEIPKTNFSDIHKIERILNQTREQLDNQPTTTFSWHDAHHYTAIYICLTIIILSFIIRSVRGRNLIPMPPIILPGAQNVGVQHI